MKKGPSGAQSQHGRAKTVDYASAAHQSSRVSNAAFIGGLLCILFAVAMTTILVLHHFGGLSLPGCGRDGGCEQAARSYWGKIPGTTWPISFVGLAYFLGLFAAWPFSRGGIAPVLRNLVRLGVVISLFYISMLIVQKHLCLYCLGTHSANIVFWIIIELSGRRSVGSNQPVLVLVGVFVFASAALFVTEGRERGIVAQKAEADRAESVAEILKSDEKKALALEQSKKEEAARNAIKPSETPKTNGASPVAQKDTTTIASKSSDSSTTAPANDRTWPGGFTGRYLLGPKEAKVRIVMISDYQCVDCNRIEPEIMRIYEENKDSVSISMKHFPMCKDCNRFFASHSLHANACWAARAAETAGILGGNEGFWKMHKWLFENAGNFTDEFLKHSLPQLGFDHQQFVSIMMSDQPLGPIKADIEEANGLGLYYTPMVFINGVELKGVFAANAVPNTVKQILAKNPPAMTCRLDQPPPAAHRIMTDWLEQPLRRIPTDQTSWARGSASAKATIVIWGDYQEPNTAEADKLVRDFMGTRDDVRYDFRHYPFDQACNSQVPLTKHPQACRTARAAEAAGRIGGVDAYWKMHVWLFEHQTEFSDDLLRQAVLQMEMDPTQFFETMALPEVDKAIQEDAIAAKQLGLTAIPFVFLNGKFVPRWRMEGTPIFARMIKVAAGESDPILSRK